MEKSHWVPISFDWFDILFLIIGNWDLLPLNYICDLFDLFSIKYDLQSLFANEWYRSNGPSYL